MLKERVITGLSGWSMVAILAAAPVARPFANELLLKLDLQVSPRTVRRCMPTYLNHSWRTRVPSQR